jgi:hypothetical protein
MRTMTLRRAVPAAALLSAVLLSPLPALAKKGAPPPPPAAPPSALDAVTVRVPGEFRRVSSADLPREAVLSPGESTVLAEMAGPGVIDRLWIAIEAADSFWRDIVVQVTWDGAAAPSVEAPIGDFFCVGPGARQKFQSLPMAVASDGRAFTSLWKMPFGNSARITLLNEGVSPTRQLAWEVDWRKLPSLPPGSLYFHAQYTQAAPPEEGRPLTVLRASGRGQFVGLSMVAQNAESGAWGNGAARFVVDGDPARGPGPQNVLGYFGNMFGLGVVSGPFQGATLDEGDRPKARSSVYRFHVLDPVPFDQSIEVTVDHGVKNERHDALSAVAYWYQDSPGVPFARLAASRERRWPAPSDAELALWRKADEIDKAVIEAYRRNDYEEALKLLEQLIKLEPESVYASYNLACLYSLKGDTDKALHMLETAIEGGFTELSFARHDPDLAALHGFERFKILVGLQEPSPGPARSAPAPADAPAKKK